MPPSAALLRDVLQHQKPRALWIPPSIAEQLLQEPDGVQWFQCLDFVCYTGGPFSQESGELLSQVTELVPLYGSTEAFQVPQLAPQDPRTDYAYMEWNPVFKLEMQPSQDEPGSFEMVLFANADTETMSALNHNLPGVYEWRTKDLFKRHPDPLKPDMWSYYGRRDDIIILSNSEKFNPVPMELAIQSHPMVSGALIVGQGKTQAALLVEPKPDFEDHETFLKEIWPKIELANLLAPAPARITRSKILVSRPDKTLTRAAKGTIVRKLTDSDYHSEIQALYSRETPLLQSFQIQKLSLKPSLTLDSVLSFVREAVVLTMPSAATLLETEDLFVNGLDSLKCTELCKALISGLQNIEGTYDLSWISTRMIYEHPTISAVAGILHTFAITGKAPQLHRGYNSARRAGDVQAMVHKYTHGLPSPHTASGKCCSNDLQVILTGSTGSLGIELLHEFLQDPQISKIYCLNRGSDAQARQEAALLKRFASKKHNLSKIVYHTVELGAPIFGLTPSAFQVLVDNVNLIVHNAWKVDFIQPLTSFEPQILGVRNLVELSIKSHLRPRIIFVSSISSVINWSKIGRVGFPTEEPLSEDCHTFLKVGYAESKYISERILQTANEQSGVPVSILRVGQIGGSTIHGDIGRARQDWLVSLIQTSSAMRLVPTGVALVDWMPINELGRVILDILHFEKLSADIKIFNLVHPQPLPWNALIETLVDRFGMKLKLVSLKEWVGVLHASTNSNIKDVAAKPAVRLLSFFEALGDGRELYYHSDNCIKASETFRLMQPVNKQWIEASLRQMGL